MSNQLSTGALVAVAAAGGFGALLAGLVAAFVNWRTESRRAAREHQTWLREQKYVAYSEFAATARIVGTLGKVVGADPEGTARDTLLTFNQRYYCALLLMSPDNLTAFEEAHQAFLDAKGVEAKGQAGKSMLAALRRDLQSTVPDP